MKGYYAPKSSLLKGMLFFLDWVFSFIIYGASISDYFSFSFYDKNHAGRKKYVTYRKYRRILSVANDSSAISVCRSKLQFNEYFKDFLHRKTIAFSDISEDSLRRWLSNIHGRSLFVKEAYSFRGKGVQKINVDNIDVPEFYKNLLKLKMGGDCIVLEEELIQDDEIAMFHPWSVNTIRVVTLYDTSCEEVHVMDAGLRIGNNKNSVDNFHFGGIYGQIDINTGIICGKAFNTNNERFIYHPLFKKQIVGFKIENWEELLEYVRKAARQLPKVRYVGWDVVVLKNGGFALIEANDNADHDLQQMYRGGLWQDYKKILKRL